VNLDLSKQELTVLRNHLAKELKYFYQTPTEWDFWKETCHLEEMDLILKKIDYHLDLMKKHTGEK